MDSWPYFPVSCTMNLFRFLNADVLCIALDVVVVSGLDEKKPPDTRIEIVIAKAPAQRSEVQKRELVKKSARPRWLDGDAKLTLYVLSGDYS